MFLKTLNWRPTPIPCMQKNKFCPMSWGKNWVNCSQGRGFCPALDWHANEVRKFKIIDLSLIPLQWVWTITPEWGWDRHFQTLAVFLSTLTSTGYHFFLEYRKGLLQKYNYNLGRIENGFLASMFIFWLVCYTFWKSKCKKTLDPRQGVGVLLCMG